MNRVPAEVNKKCVQLGFDVLEEKIALRDAVKAAALAGMKIRSARTTINVIQSMSKGETYTYGLSAPQTEYALTVFRDRSGNALLQKALKSLEGHIPYYERARAKRGSIRMHSLRNILEKFRTSVSELPTLESLLLIDAKALEDAQNGSQKDRLKRLETAPARPEKVMATTYSFRRNQDVVAEVLYRANGQCGHCNAMAPFLREKGKTPYLEVHHCTPLAENGDDTVDNAIALCPNCHREAHLGTEHEKFRR